MRRRLGLALVVLCASVLALLASVGKLSGAGGIGSLPPPSFRSLPGVAVADYRLLQLSRSYRAVGMGAHRALEYRRARAVRLLSQPAPPEPRRDLHLGRHRWTRRPQSGPFNGPSGRCASRASALTTAGRASLRGTCSSVCAGQRCGDGTSTCASTSLRSIRRGNCSARPRGNSTGCSSPTAAEAQSAPLRGHSGTLAQASVPRRPRVALASHAPAAAIVEARHAFEALERLGAIRDAHAGAYALHERTQIRSGTLPAGCAAPTQRSSLVETESDRELEKAQAASTRPVRA